MQAIGYIRVSTDAPATEGVSLAAQRARIRAWAASRGTKLVAIHADEGVSGKQADNRPGLQTALAASFGIRFTTWRRAFTRSVTAADVTEAMQQLIAAVKNGQPRMVVGFERY